MLRISYTIAIAQFSMIMILGIGRAELLGIFDKLKVLVGTCRDFIGGSCLIQTISQ